MQPTPGTALPIAIGIISASPWTARRSYHPGSSMYLAVRWPNSPMTGGCCETIFKSGACCKRLSRATFYLFGSRRFSGGIYSFDSIVPIGASAFCPLVPCGLTARLHTQLRSSVMFGGDAARFLQTLSDGFEPRQTVEKEPQNEYRFPTRHHDLQFLWAGSAASPQAR